MGSKTWGYFAKTGRKRKSFIIITILAMIALVLGIFSFGYQFIYFQEVENSNGLYMNLSEKSPGGVCASYPFSDNLPLEFTYITPIGEYSYVCRPEIFLQMIGHVVVTFSFSFFCGATYVFGIILVQKKVFYFIPLFAIFSLSMIIVCVYEIIITEGNVAYCESDLIRDVFNGTKTEFTPEPVVYPTDIDCSMTSNIVFAVFRIILGCYGLVVTALITVVYLMYRRDKKQEQLNADYHNMDGEAVTPLDNKEQSTTDQQIQIQEELPVSSVPVYEEEEKSKSKSSSSSSKHSYSSSSSSSSN